MKHREVLIVASHFYPNFGGVETHLDDLVRVLAKRGWKVVVATYKPLARNIKAPFFEMSKNLKIYRMPWIGFNIVHRLTPYPVLEFLYLFPGLFIITAISLFLNLNIKVIHAQGLVPTVVSLIWGRILSKKVISSTHNLYFFPKYGLYTMFSKFIFSKVDVTLCLSKGSQLELQKIGVSKKKLAPFRYWLNLGLFRIESKEVLKKELNLTNKFVAFFVGRIIETKGVKVILEVAKKLPRVTFLFGGEGPLSESVKKAASKNKNIIYLGYISQGQVKKYMNTSDIVLVPSLVDEGYGRVAMEAIACGTPVLAARRGGLSEVVDSSVGILIEPTAKEYSKWLTYFSKSPSKLQDLAKNTRTYALKNFSEKNVKKIIDAYSK